MLWLCWIDIYLKLFDNILHDADKNFVNKKFCQLITFMKIITKSVSVEIHWSIEIIEQYYLVLRQTYRPIIDDSKTSINKKITLQMTMKAINDTAKSDEFVFTLLVFEIYSSMNNLSLSSLFIIQWAITIQKTMNEIKKCQVERQMTNAFNTRNKFVVILLHDLVFNFDMLV